MNVYCLVFCFSRISYIYLWALVINKVVGILKANIFFPYSISYLILCSFTLYYNSCTAHKTAFPNPSPLSHSDFLNPSINYAVKEQFIIWICASPQPLFQSCFFSLFFVKSPFNISNHAIWNYKQFYFFFQIFTLFIYFSCFITLVMTSMFNDD